jgi:hypothetical protein
MNEAKVILYTKILILLFLPPQNALASQLGVCLVGKK